MKKRVAFFLAFFLVSSCFLATCFAGTGSELDGDWTIKAYVSPKDELLLDAEIVFENGGFLITGDYLVQMPWEDKFSPKRVSQAGTFSVAKNKIEISNYESLEGSWNFSGTYRLLLFTDVDQAKKSIRRLRGNTYYFYLENKNKPAYALFVSEG